MCNFYLMCLILMALLLGVSICQLKVPEESLIGETFENWPLYRHFGQISAVAVDIRGKIYVFHRGNRQWNYYTFSRNTFTERSKGPIKNETIVLLDPVHGSLITKTGYNFFYLPHGLTIDNELNVWVTDVAMHQVFKFPQIEVKTGMKPQEWKPLLTLGVLFEPGNDDNHFCKPSGVAVDNVSKDFYVSDGYCNSRIIKFDSSGKRLLQWGRSSKDFLLHGYMLNVPHALVLVESKKTLYVADRENFRVVSYDSEYGKFKKIFAEDLKSRIFSVDYSFLEGGLLFVLANNVSSQKMVAVYNAETGKFLINLSSVLNLTNPHDIALSPDGRYCYVVELVPYKIWKIKIDSFQISKKFHQNQRGESIDNQNKGIEEPIPAESKISKSDIERSGSFLAVGLVASVVVFSCLFFLFHYFKRNGSYMRYQTRRLILDDDETGIQLT